MKASIIIPSYNSKERLYYNLLSLNNQDCNFEIFEVIVVDNGSNDDTLQMLKKFKAKYNLKFKRIEKNSGIAHGRNEAIKMAEGDILIFHDSDMIAPKDFVTKHLNDHKEQNIVVCGISWKRIITFYYEELEKSGTNYELLDYLSEDFKKINKYPTIKKQSIIDGSYMNYSFDLDSDFTRVLKGILNDYRDNLDDYMLPWRLFITNNASVERKKVLDVGMFDEAIVGYGFEDYDLGIRLYKSGSKFIYDEDILSVHQEHPTNIKAVEIGTNTSYICNKYNNIYFIDVILIEENDEIYAVALLQKGPIPFRAYLLNGGFGLLKFISLKNMLAYFKFMEDTDKELEQNVDFNWYLMLLAVAVSYTHL
ncbi:MAG: glycosyltransferase family 2 protein, partial [Clostridium butyricum]|nr:glycosyltransferase family 2 protein [Clostridium butyricum]